MENTNIKTTAGSNVGAGNWTESVIRFDGGYWEFDWSMSEGASQIKIMVDQDGRTSIADTTLEEVLKAAPQWWLNRRQEEIQLEKERRAEARQSELVNYEWEGMNHEQKQSWFMNQACFWPGQKPGWVVYEEPITSLWGISEEKEAAAKAALAQMDIIKELRDDSHLGVVRIPKYPGPDKFLVILTSAFSFKGKIISIIKRLPVEIYE
jgi:hypothetical protein